MNFFDMYENVKSKESVVTTQQETELKTKSETEPKNEPEVET